MFFSWLSKLLASLLVSVLLGAVIMGVLSQTVLTSHYIEGQLAATDSYNRLSTALSDQIAQSASKDIGVAASPLIAGQLKTILTPDVIKQKINSALDQMQAYYRGNGPQPVIDLTDLAANAQAIGIPVGEESGITKPIVLGGNSNVQAISKTFDTVRLSTIIGSLVLIVALLALSWRQKRYTTLPNVLISVAVFIGLLALVLGLAPGLFDHYVAFTTNSNAFVALGHDVANSIAKDLARRFGSIAGIGLVIGIAARIVVKRLQPKPLPNLQAPIRKK